MLLSAKPIINYCDINMFTYGNQWCIRAGETNTLYFQLVDLNQNSLRYLTGIGVQNQPVQVQVTFPSVDDSAVITVTATQADVNESSIWMITLAASQRPMSGNVLFAVAEGNNTRRFSVLNMLCVEQVIPNNGSC